MLLTWLKRPFPFIDEIKFNLLLSLALSVLAFLILFIFRPYGLEKVSSTLFIAGFGLNAFLGIGIHLLIMPKVFPKIFMESKWNIQRHLLFLFSMCLLISILNYFYNSYVGKEISPQHDFFTFIFFTTAVGIFPIVVLTYVFEKYQALRNERLAGEIDIPIEKKPDDTLSIVPDTNQHEKLTILTSAFLYAESDKNYCKIYYLYQGQVKRQLMRLSLKNLVIQLSSRSQIIRVHRSFVVNKENIEQVTGNARSLLLKMKEVEDRVPVSRSFNKKLL